MNFIENIEKEKYERLLKIIKNLTSFKAMLGENSQKKKRNFYHIMWDLKMKKMN